MNADTQQRWKLNIAEKQSWCHLLSDHKRRVQFTTFKLEKTWRSSFRFLFYRWGSGGSKTCLPGRHRTYIWAFYGPTTGQLQTAITSQPPSLIHRPEGDSWDVGASSKYKAGDKSTPRLSSKYSLTAMFINSVTSNNYL